MNDYIFAAGTIILILLFYLTLPDLDSIFKKRRKNLSGAPDSLSSAGKNKKISKTDLLVISALTLIFGIVDFISLGNTVSPETFELMDGQEIVIELDDDDTPFSLMLFCGVGVGQYDISYSENGEEYYPSLTYDQTYVSVLKWEEVIPVLNGPAHYFKIRYSGSGGYLGEISVLDADRHPMSFSCNIPALCDEQNCVPSVQTFMNSTYFDEIYHARTAWEHLHGIYPYEISHPPLGKLIIALGITLFGMTPFGWRFSGTLFGVLMLPLIYVFAKKLFSDTRISACCTVLAGTDFMHYVQTRIATIDTFGVFFILLMYLFMYEYLETRSLKSLALCGISFGLGAASKWTCIYAGAGLAVIWLADRWIHRKEGFTAFLRNALFCVCFFVVIPCVIYYLSYIPYGIASGVVPVFGKGYFKIVADTQAFMFRYHSKLVAEHPYSSVWYQWLLDIRPILYYLQAQPDGRWSEFGAFSNPVLCWGGLIALLLMFYCALMHRDQKAWFLLAAYSAQLIPWIFITRLTFAYHYFPCCMFLVFAMGYIFSLMKDGVKRWKLYMYSFTALSAAVFILFYPVLSGKSVDPSFSARFLKWLPTWPF